MKKNGNMTVNRFSKYKKRKTLAFLTMLVVFIGAVSIGVLLILSEVLFYEVEEFSFLPLWYRTTIYASLMVVAGGLVGCGFTKNRLNTTGNELAINIFLFVFGFAVSFFFALWGTEANWKNLLICIGGAMSSVGLFCGIASLIGLSKKSKSQYALLFALYARDRRMSYRNPHPARLRDIKKVEACFGAQLPDDFVEFLSEFNGEDEFLYSTEEIIRTTKLFRENVKTASAAKNLCFIGQDGEGNYFCYKILDDGTIDCDVVYLLKNAEELIPVAHTITELIEKYYEGRIVEDTAKNKTTMLDGDDYETIDIDDYNKFTDWYSNVNEKDIENDEVLFGAYQIMCYETEIANGGFDQFWDVAEDLNWDLEKMQQTFKDIFTENHFSLFSEAIEAHEKGLDCEKFNARFDYVAFGNRILPKIVQKVVEVLER